VEKLATLECSNRDGDPIELRYFDGTARTFLVDWISGCSE
jgi:hypothetical protein